MSQDNTFFEPTPIDMILYCPQCQAQHIDWPEPQVEHDNGAIEFEEWTNPPHRSHLCHSCGFIWRPADVPTNGVKEIKTKGKNDSEVIPWTKSKEKPTKITIRNANGPVNAIATRQEDGSILIDLATFD